MQGSSAFDALLTQCRDLFCAQLDAAFAAMLGKTDAALSELATKTQNRETQKLYLEAKELARSKRAEFETQFHARFVAEFQERTNKAKKIGGSFSDSALSSLELSLVADDDLEETLKFNELAARLRRICEEEINALDQRVGVLMGDADLQSEDNPFSPQAVCDAYMHACHQLIEKTELRPVFLALFDDHVLDAIRSIYKALNDLLVQNSILPKIRYGAARKDKAKKKKFKEVDSDEEDESPAEDMFAALQKLMAAAGGGGGGGGGPGTGVGGTPLMQGAELLGSLTQLQLDGLAALGAGATLPLGGGTPGATNILHELKSSSVGSSMGQMDAMTLDIVARLFDQLFDDPKIPLGAKGLIGRLQIPMLKAAIADKEIFKNKDHPARLLLDTLGEIAIRLPADFNTDSALFGHLEAILQELTTGYKDDIEIFGVVREGLIALMNREDERIEAEAQAAAEKIVQEEALGVAKSAAQAAVSARLQAGSLPGPVLEFIIEQWLQLMMLIHVKRGAPSEPWDHAIAVVDDLIWSVQPNKTKEDRRKLAKMVPGLIKSITAGLRTAGIDDAVREAFFPELMRLHTDILSAPVNRAPAAEAPKAPAASLNFTANISMKNPFGDGKVQVLDGDPEETAANFSRHGTDPDALRVGDWFEWKAPAGSEEVHRPVRLIFMTPRKSRYIFCDRGKTEYIECTRNEIVRRLRTGEAVLMEEEPEVPFFERIMGGVISKMKSAVAPA